MQAKVYQFRHNREWIQVEPWGLHALRLRITLNETFSGHDGALLPPAEEGVLRIEQSDDARETRIVHGNVQLDIVLAHKEPQPTPYARLVVRRHSDQKILFSIRDERRLVHQAGGALCQAMMTCDVQVGERLYGLGQHAHGRLDQAGCVLDLRQRNGEVAIPWLYSNKGYGLLWNHRGTGRVELAANHTRWVADATPEIDIWFVASDLPADALSRYADATGHVPDFPRWASGFWQCKLRYASQKELMEVAREYKRRGLPISVIVADYFHWDRMGEWRFDPVAWPDPEAMVAELRAMGIELMVSIWPTVNPACQDFAYMEKNNLLLQTDRGVSSVTHFLDTYEDQRVYLHHLDPTNPAARKFHWEKVKRNYYDAGIRAFWLDACEPEINPQDYEHLRFHVGPGCAVACAYPQALQQAYYDGLTAAGEKEILTLCRSAWAGSQRYGAAVWSGDIPSTFDSLSRQIRAGLNMAMSGIPWWCTDIGGFTGGDPRDETFRELIVRWFQYGLFCPIFRLHGVRQPETLKSGGPNEVWSFGDKAYDIIRTLLEIRERLRPYVHAQMRKASESGIPPMRPLFVDFPDDPEAWASEDQFLFGADLIVAPVTEQGAVERSVYLPSGCAWYDVCAEQHRPGGGRFVAPAALYEIPVYIRVPPGGEPSPELLHALAPLGRERA